jgi:DNA-binding Lrp family transcriptional regulator
MEKKIVMPTAYVLLNTEIGSEKSVLKALKALDGVEEAYNLWGVYDIIINVSAKSMDELKHIITKEIDGIGRINSKLTMITSDKSPVIFNAGKDGPEHGLIDREPMSVYA